MPASQIDYTIRISQQLTGDNALGKLQSLEKQLGSETRAISAMEVKLDSARVKMAAMLATAQSGGGGNYAAVDKMRAKIAGLESDLGKRRGNLAGLMGGLGGAQEAAQTEASSAAMVQGLGSVGGAALQAAKLVLAFAAAVTVAFLALSSFALGAANAHRSLLLTQTALAGSAAAAGANVAAIERVADSTAVAKGQIEEIGQRLAVAGIDGDRFERTLGTISLATALLGASAGSHLESIIERSKALGHFQFSDRQLKGLGISFGDLAAQVGMTAVQFKAAMKAGTISVETGVDAMNAAITKRLGAGGAALMLDFNVQVMKLREHLGALFKDVSIEPFLKALHDLLSIFDQSTVSGQALHFLATQIFGAIFDGAAKGEPLVKVFFQGMIIGALQLYIAVIQIKNVLSDAFGGDAAGGIDNMTLALNAGLAVMSAFVVVVGPFAGILYNMLAPLVQIQMILDAFTLPDLGAQGGSMVDGLVNAVTDGAGRFAAAMKDLGAQGMAALNSIFHFGSPSRAMEQRGEWIDEGGARGVEQGGAMRRAMSGMAQPADVRGEGRDRDGGRGATTIYIDARGADRGAVDYLMDKLGDVFEGAAILAGVGPTPEPA